MKLADEENLAGCCGMYCGLCPRYQSTAESRCAGCKVVSLTISCKLYNCCVKKKGFATCAECDDFPCTRYDGFFDWDSFVTHAACRQNIERIRTVGLEAWLREQGKRGAPLESLLANYNDGRSRSFYCVAAALMLVALLAEAVNQARKTMASSNVADSDLKGKGENRPHGHRGFCIKVTYQSEIEEEAEVTNAARCGCPLEARGRACNASVLGGSHHRARRERRECMFVASRFQSRHGRDGTSWARCPCHDRTRPPPVWTVRGYAPETEALRRYASCLPRER